MNNYKNILAYLLSVCLVFSSCSAVRENKVTKSEDTSICEVYYDINNLGIIRLKDYNSDKDKFFMYDKLSVETIKNNNLYLDGVYSTDLFDNDVISIKYKSLFDNSTLTISNYIINYSNEEEKGMMTITDYSLISNSEEYSSYNKNKIIIKNNKVKESISYSKSKIVIDEEINEYVNERVFEIEVLDLDKLLYENSMVIKNRYSNGELLDLLNSLNLDKKEENSYLKTI